MKSGIIWRWLLLMVGFGAVRTMAGERAETNEITVVLVGDSTVCNYPSNSVTRGWGEFIQPVFKDNVRVVNLAASGRSTKTFIQEGRWEKALHQHPSFILIQFGHNDSHDKKRPEATDAATDYKDYLRRYVDDARRAGAKPVLVTPMHRRRFASDGKLTRELQPYVEAMKQIANEKKVPLIDLFAMSEDLFQKLGDAASGDLSCKPEDRTHFSAKGAQIMADLVAKTLPQVEPTVKPLLKK